MDRARNLHYEGHTIRTYLDDNRFWFVASDLARALGFPSGFAMARTVPVEDKKFLDVETGGGRHESTIISDIGLIVFAARTRKPFGRKLLKWVLHEVHPGLN
mgnify:CR=1 FL=1|jgi:prophage antirepressor-like protein